MTLSRGPLRRPHPLRPILAAALAALVLVACEPVLSPGAEAPEPARLFESVPSTPELAPSAAASHGWQLAPAVGDLPGLGTAVRTSPGGSGEAGVWTWVGGDGMERVPEDLAIPGSVTSVHLAAGPGQALLAVTSWDGHAFVPSLRTSDDRRSWSVLEPPPEVRALRWEAAAAVGESMVVAGSDRTGGSRVLVVSGSERRTSALPAIADVESRRLLGVAGSGDQVVVLASVGRRGGLGTIGVYESSDAGRTFGGFAAIDADGWAEAGGIVWTGAGYVVTGSVPRTAEAPDLHEPVAWVSTDGAGWQRGEVTTPEEENWDYLLRSDVRLGRPSVGPDGTVTAVLSHEHRTASAFVLREPDGRWSAILQESSNDAQAVGGVAVLAPDGYVYAAQEHDGRATLERVSTDGWTKRVGQMTARDDSATIREVAAEPGQLRFVAYRDVTSGSGAEWSSASEASVVVYDGSGSLVADASELPGTAGASRVAFAADPVTGAAVVIATHETGSTSTATASFRSGAGQPWQPSAGFEAPARIAVHLLARTATGWVAAGFAGESLDDPQHSTRMSVWESSDGLAWQLADGALVTVDGNAVVRRLCSLPDGTPVAIGDVERDGTTRAAVWRRAAEAWVRSDVGPTDVASSLRSCATTDTGLLLGGGLDGAAVMWRTTDGSSLDAPVVLADRGAVRSLVAVPGGHAAAGGTDDDEHSGPTVWLSADGVSWSRHVVPARESGDAYLAAELDGDLVVVLGGEGGQEVHVVRDVGDVLARAHGRDG